MIAYIIKNVNSKNGGNLNKLEQALAF